MTERDALLAKAAQYLDSARLLLEKDDHDSAVSRIYYAAFYVAEVLLDSLGKSFSSHRGVISAFGQEFAKTGDLDPKYHRLLIVAFEKRQRGDYMPVSGIAKDEVRELLAEAEGFLNEAKQWLKKKA